MKGAVLPECGCSTSDVCLVRSPSGFFGVTLCWNNKGYWCLKEVPAKSFLVVGKMSVIITVFRWCCPINLDIPLCYTSIQRHLTSDWGQPASSFYSSYCTWTMTRLCTNLQVSVCIFQYWIYFTESFLDLYLYIIHINETEIMNTNKEIYSVLKFTVVCHIVFICLQSYSGISEREDVVWSFEECQASGSPAVHCGS